VEVIDWHTHNNGWEKGRTSWEKATAVVEFLIRYLPQILLLVGTILTILTSAFPAAAFNIVGFTVAWRWVLAACAVGCLSAGTISSFRGGSLLSEMQREAEQAKALIEGYRGSTENLLEFLVKELLEEIELTTEKGAPKPEIRCSVYCLTADREHFLLTIRKAGNPEWERSRSKQYKAGMGAIDECWQLGSSRVRVEGRSGREWVNCMVEDYGLPYEVASEIRMQSQRMVLVRLEGNVGVLVVESVKQRMLRLKKEDEILKSAAYPLICQVVESLKEPHLMALSQ